MNEHITGGDRMRLLRAEDIKARFLLYGHTTFALSGRDYWTGFNWHPWVNEVKS